MLAWKKWVYYEDWPNEMNGVGQIYVHLEEGCQQDAWQ